VVGITTAPRIILTSDESLATDFRGVVHVGFVTCLPEDLWIRRLLRKLVCITPPIDERTGEPQAISCGLAKIEAALYAYGFTEKDLRVVHPRYLRRVASPETRIILITAMDPLGLGPATTTVRGLMGREPYDAASFRRLMKVIRDLRKSVCPEVKVIVGGPGSWQLLVEDWIMDELGVDCVVIGEGELVIGPLVEKALKGEKLPRVVRAKPVPVDRIPIVRRPTIKSFVEITRGCWRGCAFCEPTTRFFRTIPLENILKEVEIMKKVSDSVVFQTEDVFSYGYKPELKGYPNEGAIVKLYRSVKNILGSPHIYISHFSFPPVVLNPKVLEEINDVCEVSEKHIYGGIPGIESGSPKIIDRWMRGKAYPFKPEEWPEIVEQAIGILNDYMWFPACTMIVGFPDETPDDVMKTMELLENLRKYACFVCPFLLVPLGRLSNLGVGNINLFDEHIELMKFVWIHNMDVLNKFSRYLGGFGFKGLIASVVIKAATFVGKYLISRWSPKDKIESIRRNLVTTIRQTLDRLRDLDSVEVEY